MLLVSHISIIWFIFSLITYIETEYWRYYGEEHHTGNQGYFILWKKDLKKTDINNTKKGLAFIGINYCKAEEEGIIAGHSRSKTSGRCYITSWVRQVQILDPQTFLPNKLSDHELSRSQKIYLDLFFQFV